MVGLPLLKMFVDGLQAPHESDCLRPCVIGVDCAVFVERFFDFRLDVLDHFPVYPMPCSRFCMDGRITFSDFAWNTDEIIIKFFDLLFRP